MVSHSVQLLFIKPLILPHTSHTKSFALSFQFFTRLAAVFAELLSLFVCMKSINHVNQS
jgi:hypothetical protein